MVLTPLSIPGLTKLPQKTWQQNFKLILDDFVSLTPIQGWILVQHQGSYLRVTTEAKTIINLTCDRCLQQYNHRLQCQVEELIWLEADELEFGADTGSQELDLLERLPAQGEFDPQDWLYQQLCLSLPHPQLCQVDCQGLDVVIPTSSELNPESILGDHRWASLAALKQKLDD